MPYPPVVRFAWKAGVLGIAVVLLWAGIVLLTVRQDLSAARSALEAAREGGLTSAADSLGLAQLHLEGAQSQLDQPGPWAAAALPVLGRPFDAARRTTSAALAAVRASRQVLDEAEGSTLFANGTVDLDALTRVADALDEAAELTREPIAALLDQPTGLLPAALADPVGRAQRELGDLPSSFARASSGARALTGVLGSERPRRLLLLLQNNAELRGTGGIVTVFAEATAEQGRLEIQPFRDVDEVADQAPGVTRVDAPEDYQRLWGDFLANTTLWKNTNMSPDVPTSSAVLAKVAGASLTTPPDAMMWFDAPAMAAVLGAIGPGRLPDGSTLTSENAVETLLSTAYKDAPDTPDGQTQRRAALRAAADAVLGRAFGPQESSAASATALALVGAARGRHMSLWSAVPAEQSALVEAGLAGDVAAEGGDLSSFTVQNLGGGDEAGNKLDYYARRRVAHRVVLDGEGAEVLAEVHLENDAPASGLPPYVAGRATPGTSNNLVTLAMPRGAELVEFRRDDSLLEARPQSQGDHQVVVDLVSIPSGGQVTWQLRYRLPVADDQYVLRVVPQPLAFDAELDVEVRAGDGVALVAGPASALTGDEDALHLTGPLTDEQELRVDTEGRSLLRRGADALRRFWSEPVSLP